MGTRWLADQSEIFLVNHSIVLTVFLKVLPHQPFKHKKSHKQVRLSMARKFLFSYPS